MEDHKVEDVWAAFRGSVIGACDEFIIPVKYQQKKKQWMTDEILEMMDDRREIKTANHQAYRQIYMTFKKNIREVKKRCHEFE